MVDGRKLDFTKYGSLCKEWKDFVHKYPAEAEANGLPEDAPKQHAGKDIPDLPEGIIDAKKLGLNRSLGQEDSRVKIQELTIRSGWGRRDRARLMAWVYSRIPFEDELVLDGGLPCVVYFHSGGYGLFGEPDTERKLCSEMAVRTRIVVVHICYRETPPHKHPDSHHDATEGLQWVIHNAHDLGIDVNQIILAGMCYGAGLAAALTLQTCAQRKDVRLKGLLLGFPWLLQEAMFPYHMFASRGATSRYQCATAPTMSKRTYDDMQRHLGHVEHQRDPLLNVPLAKDEELEKFPRTALILAGNDILRDDGILFAERLRSLG
jgi:acetyl esterase/lipase